VADHYAQDDAHALAIARRASAPEHAAQAGEQLDVRPAEPLHDPADIYGVIPADPASPTTCARSSRAWWTAPPSTSSSSYGTTLVTGFAHICTAMPVGILANNGILFSESALKGAHFIELCCQRGSRCSSCRTSPASWWASKYEAGGIAKDGAKMVTAVANARSAQAHGDHRRLVRRGQLRHVRPRLRAAVPVDVAERRISVMGGEQAANVLATVRGDGLESRGEQLERGRRGSLQEPDSRAVRAPGPPLLLASARLWDDGVVDPADTRRLLALALSASLNAPIEPTRFGVFRM
jgi:3-methylcrotonyl-CoA carboxylase beta subunit